MKKTFLGLALLATLAAAAQTKKKAPPPPPEPPPVAVVHAVPPPPPPPPPRPPRAPLPKDYDQFLQRNPSVKSVTWSRSSVIIRSKSGTEERFALDDNGTRQAEAKYGKLPKAPPPPPPMVAPPPPPRPPDVEGN